MDLPGGDRFGGGNLDSRPDRPKPKSPEIGWHLSPPLPPLPLSPLSPPLPRLFPPIKIRSRGWHLEKAPGETPRETLRKWLAPGVPGTAGAQSSRKARVTGSLAARTAGNSPPSRPRKSERTKAETRSSGVTSKAKVTWLKLSQLRVDAR